ncbi:MAG: phosphate ABC transporter substrate-binding protein PstS family protein [Candidatus Dormibacteria bacterium]
MFTRLAGPILGVLLLAAGTACGSDNSGSSASSSNAPGSAGSGSAACGSGSVTASGSTALLPLVQKAADAYKAKCPGASITVSGGGSSTGLANVASGTSDIGMSDVPAKNAKSIDPASLQDHQVAVVVFAVAVNQAAGVTNLTSTQVKNIFSGKVANWKDVGGANVPVTLYLRKPGSGTRLAFDDIVMKGTAESGSPAGVTDSTQQLLTQLAGAPGGVSYAAASSISPGAGVAAVSVDGHAATADAVKSGSYPIYSHEHMFTKAGGASPLTTAFIKFILGDFQKNEVTALGFLPVATQSAPSDADR